MSRREAEEGAGDLIWDLNLADVLIVVVLIVVVRLVQRHALVSRDSRGVALGP
jgi:hypothetical protein